MHARADLRERSSTRPLRTSQRPGCCRVEPLEGRTLFAFSTVDTLPNAGYDVGMAADGLGNVYVAGAVLRYPGDLTPDGIIRQSSDGGSTWTTILSAPYELRTVAASPSGTVYTGARAYGNGWQILEKPAGDTQFRQVATATGGFSRNSLSVDAAGKAYAVQSVAVTVTGSGGKQTTEWRGAVLRQTGALGSFATVDTYAGSGRSIFATTEGVYAVGALSVTTGRTSASHWIVRKSPTGDPGTWTTVDNFQYDAANNMNSVADVVTVDTTGNVYVSGLGDKKVRTGGTDRKPIYTTVVRTLVRRSTDGGVSWKTEEVPMTGGSAIINAMGTDPAGKVYITSKNLQMRPAGDVGNWVIADDFAGLDQAEAYGFTADSNGNLYVAGFDANAGFVRKMAAPAPTSATLSSTPTGNATFSSTSISAGATDSDPLLDSDADALALLLA